MYSKIRRVGTVLISIGIDPRRMLFSIRYLPIYIWQLMQILYQIRGEEFKFKLTPVLSDRYMPGGATKGHYFHQDIWAARKIYEKNPSQHIDVGSRIDGFVAHLLTFRKVVVLDVRPITANVPGLTFQQVDLMSDTPLDLFADSVSCLHALEHFGLGRYGDPLDLDGWAKGLANLASIVKPGGHLYIGVPIGHEQCIEFNAQRIFSPQTINLAASRLNLELIEFSWVNDDGDFIQNDSISNVDCKFGCGCYLFRKSINLV